MYLKKKATVLISTVIILSLMSTLGCIMFKMIKNNKELGNLYNFDTDIYDLDKNEEEVLNKFMKELNKNTNKVDKESNSEEDTIPEGLVKKIGDSTLYYEENKEKLFLRTHKDIEIIREREIRYFFRDGKIILVPTYKFNIRLNKMI
jgi:hypothetical protein